MLQTQTVEPGTLSLLNELFSLPALEDFGLVGGTALSLKLGHRLSVDLELFSPKKFENSLLIKKLTDHFGNRLLIRTNPPPIGIFCFIDKIKVDLVKHPHPLIKPLENIEDIRFFSDQDIMAMKIQAILGRGKKKDFWDIAELLQYYSVVDFIQNHKEKYSTQNLLISIPQVMIYFQDAEEDEDPVSLKDQTWDGIKKTIREKVSEYLR
ncbi:nucleotidyl transferase AbiEii/AbiGii toxin family protein [Algoriphagus hitonicola]|uniref:Nucleotidyl transferase AbiEii toxin, Type IV TA system n=1 Tax=Algoriphagus hitonicola TaxID=435880 RepID=A0A1I2VZY2_9BACT|nr:nucleotidyl transferase AbiEii/AbiGii toxin family protein [Algoriphagus hitonicola]SFG94673.1 Nucleotidyl transferase AbiEii toxin, Type IV TA system [Algoriphagus hitonicola]